MGRVTSSYMKSLEQWSPTLFLLGGVVLVAFAASLAAIGLMDMSSPRNILAGAGFTLAFLGLFGLCAGLTDRSPRLARAGSIFAVLGGVGFTLTFVLGIAEFVEITPPAWVEAAQLLNIASIVLGFLLVGIASLRTDVYPQSLGVLLFVPAVLFAANITRVAFLGPWTPSWAPFLLGSLQAMAMLAIGYILHDESTPTEPAERPIDRAA
ncbi:MULTISPECIES: hypothetical protein [Halobacteriales]|uniref:DUF998 domain-containing protein n=1 Tax=Halorubrum laminariae TaxID=1433523 RepID=A0ABD6C630_9EURY|nr:MULTISPECIES: hypothetical protein [Halobacteria]MDL0123782.1 hypothetical protein [Halobacterium salinarum]MDL0134651.1 hypothetical protein [Halobacterium salinarum]